eukprot:TRINITY_DN18834_c0_g1_i2.p1 TRINITY_DN18834_c0_g1~~TRINITY_DN18834_c0_g1_i2.p1  ORF type:complete len:162 (+),score=26.43 TRINITY_DN18834_c0_g1_i2:87-572(+)
MCIRDSDKGAVQVPFNYALPVSLAFSSVKEKWGRQGRDFWVGATLSVKQAFLKMQLGLIGNVTKYFQTGKGHSYHTSSGVFDCGKYIKAKDVRIQGIIKELTRTQQFSSFIEKAYKFYECAGTSEIELFLKGMIMNTRGILLLSLIHICRCRRYAVCRSLW